jgi:hypothetical protein
MVSGRQEQQLGPFLEVLWLAPSAVEFLQGLKMSNGRW